MAYKDLYQMSNSEVRLLLRRHGVSTCLPRLFQGSCFALDGRIPFQPGALRNDALKM